MFQKYNMFMLLTFCLDNVSVVDLSLFCTKFCFFHVGMIILIGLHVYDSGNSSYILAIN